MAALGANAHVQAYWAQVTPLQAPLAERRPGEHWATMDELYHGD